MLHQQIIAELLKQKPQTFQELSDIKRKIAGNLKLPPPSNASLLATVSHLIKNDKTIKEKKDYLTSLLRKRRIRTLSGVAPVTVLTKPYPCPGKCIYCPTEKGMPKSYLSNEPAVMRAILCQFDPFKQVQTRLKALQENGHPTDKIELIIIGGTWSFLPFSYQEWFIKECFKAANEFELRNVIVHDSSHSSLRGVLTKVRTTKQSRTFSDEPGIATPCLNFLSENLGRARNDLKYQQKRNEKAQHRIIGLTLETRPDYITPQEIKRMRDLGCTRVELGVQHIDDHILTKIQRGHKVTATIQATFLLKEAGFKVGFHLMPGLPGSSWAKDLSMFKEIFSDSQFQPDTIKIYPCVVTKNSELYRWWKGSKYKPYSPKQLAKLLIKIKGLVPLYVRINRIIRDIPAQSIIDGNKISNLRSVLQQKMKEKKLSCQCIRCREARAKPIDSHQLKLFITQYHASKGKEYFLTFESKDKKTLYAFLRLRIPHLLNHNLITTTYHKLQKCAMAQNCNHSFTKNRFLEITNILPELKGAVLIRELHTYGQLVPLSEHLKEGHQHWGLGKQLMKEAEKITRKLGIKKIAVIAGIGVREYYRRLGYRLKGSYMVKWILP